MKKIKKNKKHFREESEIYQGFRDIYEERKRVLAIELKTYSLESGDLPTKLHNSIDYHFIKGEEKYDLTGGCCIVSNVSGEEHHSSAEDSNMGECVEVPFFLKCGRDLDPSNLQPFWGRLRKLPSGGYGRTRLLTGN